ncbi:MAG: response regulator [Anaerolineae bacterium]|nr:response regulator [Anaerolineae bacterium]
MTKILVIDDDPLFTKSTTAILTAHGYEVDTAQNGDAGLAKMREQLPDLVLLDVMMGWVLEGVSVSRTMMDQRELRRIPIIMVTSIRSTEYLGVFPQDEYLHIDSWLDKPFSPAKLIAEVEATLSRHQQYADLS